MALESLQKTAGFGVPQTGCVVETRRQNLSSLRVEDCLADLSLVSFEDCGACEGRHIINSHGHIDRGGHQTGANCVEVEV